MTSISKITGLALFFAIAITCVSCPHSAAQTPVTVAPIVVDTAVPIIINAVKPKPTGLSKFEGFVMHANTAQITVRAKGNDMAIRTFALSPEAATKMQSVVEKGGYQYGDKVTVLYNPSSLQAVKLKGKPSKAI